MTSPRERLELLLRDSCRVNDPPRFVNRCEQLRILLNKENRRQNLTRIIDENDFWNKHVADSVLVAKFIPELASQSLKVADLGCGAGFPAIPLAAAFPNLNVTAIDSAKKKCDFVRLATHQLKLKINVVVGRGRELNRMERWRNQFDVITARAVADAATILRETRSMLKKRGRIILYKTPEQAEKELPRVTKISVKTGFCWRATPPFFLPGNAGTRLFLVGETTPFEASRGDQTRLDQKGSRA